MTISIAFASVNGCGAALESKVVTWKGKGGGELIGVKANLADLGWGGLGRRWRKYEKSLQAFSSENTV